MKHIFTSFTATLVIQLFTMLGGVLTARLLLPAGKGELTAVMLWPSLLASVGNLGVIEAIAFFATQTSGKSAKILASGLTLVLGLAAGLVGIGYVILPLVWAGQETGILETARLYLVHIPLNLIALSLMSLIWGKMRLAEFNFLRTFVHVSFVVGIIVLYAVDQVSVRRFVEVSLVATLLTLLIALAIILKNRWLKWSPDVQTMKELLGYGVKAHLGSIASFANLRLDQTLMSIFLPPTALGLYVVAVTVSKGVVLGANTLVIVAFPRIASQTSVPDKKLAFGRFMRLTLLLSVLAAVALLWITPWILSFFFGVAYLPATDAARILIVASIPLGLNTLFATSFKAFNRPVVSSQAELIGLCFTGIALWVFLPRYGVMGAAYASLLAYLAVSSFMLYSIRHQLEMTLVELFRPTAGDWQIVRHQLLRLRARLLALKPERRA